MYVCMNVLLCYVMFNYVMLCYAMLCICINIYIYRERERDRYIPGNTHVHIYIYVYVYTHTYVYASYVHTYACHPLKQWPEPYTFNPQNLLFCRVPKNSILAFMVKTYTTQVGYGSLRYTLHPQNPEQELGVPAA